MLNRDQLNNLAGDIWKSAERLRGKFKAYEYQGVVLPIILLRRIECVLIAMREAKRQELLTNVPALADDPTKLQTMLKELEKLFPFHNRTDWTLAKLCEEDHSLLEGNFRAYISGFSDNVQDILEHFDYRATIGKMKKNASLVPILKQYAHADLAPETLSNLEMGYVYEELLRRFSEQSGEEAGEHFTPREVIRLMVELLDVQTHGQNIKIYDPACGTGGMLSVAKEHVLDKIDDLAQREETGKLIILHGQELQPQNYAICKADMLLKGEQKAQIRQGNSLIPHINSPGAEPGDQLMGAEHQFDYMLSNPPFGVTWGGKDGYETEARKLQKTRYKAGMPRTNDGALLFLQTMLAKMKPADKGGTRIAIIFNGSPLSNGDCGSGESEIRRWMLENDWLEAIVMLPNQLFYNTSLYTYVWVLTNNKPAGHKGKVMLIDAREQFEKEPKSFGNKRNRITDTHRLWVEKRYRADWDSINDQQVKVFRTTDFAYHKVAVVFWQTDENDQPAVVTEPYEKVFSAANIKKEQAFYNSDIGFRIRLTHGETVREIAFTLPPSGNFATLYEKQVKAAFADEIKMLTEAAAPPIPPSPTLPPQGGQGEKKEMDAREFNKLVKAFIDSLAVEVEWTHRHYIKDDEYIPYGEDIAAFLQREIRKPIIRWEDSPQLGYEILPNKYFYQYQPPKAADALLAEFWQLESQAESILQSLERSR
ncbi:MAG TPA: class I SAM-dependent DNA methyltransferase [Candidatus Thiothrix moscowensis]|uniref:type I restriction-modification system subunit M n=1 Tax=unclassified Thiothrix TaxID=2636184 RepID=UPI0025FD97A5|nr:MULTISPECIES: class I SAM-dependent DNA methyltransferase [unclassified Thiothrix]HRJ53714.1 class I SAM-dependent DNA methyltransferase [Candidatus Thiothrix moscowensis]HRJ93796.1 class I SAM-dependent DNA methyltransferase [Candidatus Thiothrix moscowensis]